MTGSPRLPRPKGLRVPLPGDVGPTRGLRARPPRPAAREPDDSGPRRTRPLPARRATAFAAPGLWAGEAP